MVMVTEDNHDNWCVVVEVIQFVQIMPAGQEPQLPGVKTSLHCAFLHPVLGPNLPLLTPLSAHHTEEEVETHIHYPEKDRHSVSLHTVRGGNEGNFEDESGEGGTCVPTCRGPAVHHRC